MSAPNDAPNDESFVPQNEGREEYSNIDAEKEDREAARSEETGEVSKQEVEGLKDSIGGGETIDERTRSSNSEVNAYKQEEALDKAVDEATAE